MNDQQPEPATEGTLARLEEAEMAELTSLECGCEAWKSKSGYTPSRDGKRCEEAQGLYRRLDAARRERRGTHPAYEAALDAIAAHYQWREPEQKPNDVHAAILAERARIVAWLRERKWRPLGGDDLEFLLERIEKGEHLK